MYLPYFTIEILTPCYLTPSLSLEQLGPGRQQEKKPRSYYSDYKVKEYKNILTDANMKMNPLHIYKDIETIFHQYFATLSMNHIHRQQTLPRLYYNYYKSYDYSRKCSQGPVTRNHIINYKEANRKYNIDHTTKTTNHRLVHNQKARKLHQDISTMTHTIIHKDWDRSFHQEPARMTKNHMIIDKKSYKQKVLPKRCRMTMNHDYSQGHRQNVQPRHYQNDMFKRTRQNVPPGPYQNDYESYHSPRLY